MLSGFPDHCASAYLIIHTHCTTPGNTRHRPTVGPMLGRRRGRWISIGPTLVRCPLFAGTLVLVSATHQTKDGSIWGQLLQR